MNWTSLHTHSQFSFLDGFGTDKQWIDRLHEIGQDSIAITDHGNIYGHPSFAKAFKKADKHLVFGCEMYMVGKLEKERYFNHITVLSKTQAGYGNLLWLVNESYKQFYYKPRITLDQLLSHNEGLVVLSGCSLDSIFIKNKAEDQEKFFSKTVKVFKKMEWYVEIQPFKDEQKKWDFLTAQSKLHKVPCVVTCDCHYPKEEYKKTQDFMLAINTNKPMSDPDRLKMEYPLHIPSSLEVYQRCKDMGMDEEEAKAALKRSYDIAHSCKVELPKTGLVVVGMEFNILRKMCFEGLVKRHLHVFQEYVDRLEYELKLIKEKNFMDYFAIITDLMSWAKKRMLCGAGRGSSAGSLACYCLAITEVDPIKHNLMFERFIDISRSDLPDIDLDFPSDKREEVIQYLIDKYGKERTAQLINFNTFKPKAIIQDAGRILGIPMWEVKEAGSQLLDRSGGDARANFCLRDSIDQFDKLKSLFTKYPKLWDAVDLEGQVRQVGKHAAAVVVARDPLDTIGAINNDGVFSIDKYNCEEHGLLKIDVLGIETLSVLSDVCGEIGMDFHDLYILPLDDKLTFEKVFTPSKLIGVFQFEGLAARQVCRDITPTNFEHLVHITALARPGPLNSGTTPEYVRRIKGASHTEKRNADFDSTDPALEPYVRETLGLILFQEQVMNAVKNLGKFSWEDTSTIRKAMSKSLGDEFFNKFKKKFVEGCALDGISEDRAQKIWKQIYTFGSWGFNKSHAVSYSYLSYWCGYMKAHYPAQYYARILKDKSEEGEIKPILKEWGGSFLPLNINRSRAYFRADGDTLVGGFTSVKGIGVAAAEKIIKAQPFESMEDFKGRVPKGVASKIEEALKGQDWADIHTLEEQYKSAIDGMRLTAPLSTYGEIIKSKMKFGIILAKVVGINLRDSNDPDKVARRGRKITGWSEYVILKIRDDNEDIWHVYCPHRLTQLNKQELLSLNGKICLFKLKRSGEINECEKFKVLTK